MVTVFSGPALIFLAVLALGTWHVGALPPLLLIYAPTVVSQLVRAVVLLQSSVFGKDGRDMT